MSVFTYDSDPPRVASPWLHAADSAEKSAERSSTSTSALPADYSVTKLPSEPQEGSTEYKLHLLLRPRRRYEHISTAERVSGSTQSRPSAGPVTLSNQTRQVRLLHLTTQLLWRLQQSCPYNPSGSTAEELVVPRLPDGDLTLDEPLQLGKPPTGLESSRGALYEIGVADDGTLVGLTKDEMDESLKTLRVMAASLGCNMEVLRSVVVGDCKWTDDETQSKHQAKLWVVEAFVTSESAPRAVSQDTDPPERRVGLRTPDVLPDARLGSLTLNQLRVTLTGPTTSGKSTLLGTLTTGLLDNGRGKSRMNLLKHRHELATGVTSSVTQEIIGYHGEDVINYAHHGVESWVSIHDYTKDGRLVYLVDSAGHPRYRRTILRGIVGWAPHWTLLCIPADDFGASLGVGASASGQEILGTGVHLATAHLELCLQLDMPMVIVVTKLDRADKSSFTCMMTKLLSVIKKTGRLPTILQSEETDALDLGHVSEKDDAAVSSIVDGAATSKNLLVHVPIVLTSAVKGSGIKLLLALLRQLPVPPSPASLDNIGDVLKPEQPSCLFHIEDKFSLPASYSAPTGAISEQVKLGTVVAGHLRFGTLFVGDNVLVGPFPSDEDEGQEVRANDDGLAVCHTLSARLNRIAQKSAVAASAVKGEWHKARVISIRNLRLPVKCLKAGQVGSVGIIFDHAEAPREMNGLLESPAPPIARLRKGKVLAIASQHMLKRGLSLQAASGFAAVFPNMTATALTAGNLVNVYVASVRAGARVVSITMSKDLKRGDRSSSGEAADVIDQIDDLEKATTGRGNEGAEQAARPTSGVGVRLDLLGNREWIELGARILLFERGRKDRSGLEGYVGSVVQIVE